VAKTLLEIERFGNKPRAVGMKWPARVMTSSVIKSSDFMKESENASDEGINRNREDMERHFSFAAAFVRVPFASMTYDNARLE
jgi:hypothetical protein